MKRQEKALLKEKRRRKRKSNRMYFLLPKKKQASPHIPEHLEEIHLSLVDYHEAAAKSATLCGMHMDRSSAVGSNAHTVDRGLEHIGSNAWWLKEVRGARLFDRAVINLLRAAYLGTRVSLRVLLGRAKRDSLFIEKQINFKDFLFHSIRLFGLDNGKLLLLLEIPVHNHDKYRAYCPLNKEDFVVMTKHEDDILRQVFRPRSGDVVVDVGAHMGRYTLTAAKSTGRDGRVIAVEAHPYNYKMLCRNIELNGVSNVIALNCAAFSEEKSGLRLYLPDEQLGYTMHHSLMAGYLVSKYHEAAEKRYIEVQAHTLDYIVKTSGVGHDRINWLKIDVEGAEYEVLKGSSQILAASKDISLLIEVHGRETYRPVLELLRSHAFEIEFERTYDNGEKHILARKGGRPFRT